MKRTKITSDRFGTGICKNFGQNLFYFDGLPPNEKKKIFIHKKLSIEEKDYIDNLCKYNPLIKLEKGTVIYHGIKPEKLISKFGGNNIKYYEKSSFYIKKNGVWLRQEKNDYYGEINLKFSLKRDIYLFYFDFIPKKLFYDFYCKRFEYIDKVFYNAFKMKKIFDKLEKITLKINDKNFLHLLKEFYKNKISKNMENVYDYFFENNGKIKNFLSLNFQKILGGKNYFIFSKFGSLKALSKYNFRHSFPYSYRYFKKISDSFGDNFPIIFQNLGIKGYHLPVDSCEIWFNPRVTNILSYEDYEILEVFTQPYIERKIFYKIKENENGDEDSYKIIKNLLEQ